MSAMMGPTLQLVDLPEVSETYADSLDIMMVDGGLCRFNFVVHRLDMPKPPKTPTGKKYPSCRLVMPLPGALTLYNQLRQMIELMEKQGIVKQGQIQQPPSGPLSIQ